MRKIFSINLLLLLSIVVSYSQIIRVEGPIEFFYTYPSENSKTILEMDVMNNKVNLARVLSNTSGNNKADIISGRKHVSIVACILKNEINNAKAINRASLQASVIRAQLKLHAGIPHECIAFAIDTTENISNKVLVKIFDGPLPQGSESSNIQYIEKGDCNKIFSMYNYKVPYGNYMMIFAKNEYLKDK